MIKAITVGYKSARNTAESDVLYAGNDRAAALQAGKNAEGYEKTECYFYPRIGKRFFFDAPAPAPAPVQAEDTPADEDKPQRKYPTIRRK